MSYSASACGQPGAEALGRMFTMSMQTPWGSKSVAVDVPIDQVANQAVESMKARIPQIMDPALAYAGKYMEEQLWPKLKPLLRSEADQVLDEASVRADERIAQTKTTAGYVAGALILTLFGAATVVVVRRQKASQP